MPSEKIVRVKNVSKNYTLGGEDLGKLRGRSLLRVIYVPGRLVNIVVR